MTEHIADGTVPEEPDPVTAEVKPAAPVTVTRKTRTPWYATAGVAVIAVLGLIFPLSPPAESALQSQTAPSLVNASFDGTVTLTDVSALAAEAVDSVVEIRIARSRGPFSSRGSGSGVIVDADGLIVTNAHVVEGADTVEVVLSNGLSHRGQVIASDPSRDLTVVKVEDEGLQPIEFGSSTELAVGQPVVAIGNPLGLEGGPSVSTGIVSALNRNVRGRESALTDVIQTDAAITQGSSGGALLDAGGRLIGITTAVGVSRIGIEGIGFAIPVEAVVDILAQVDGV